MAWLMAWSGSWKFELNADSVMMPMVRSYFFCAHANELNEVAVAAIPMIMSA